MHAARHKGILYSVEALIAAAKALPEEEISTTCFAAQIDEGQHCWEDDRGRSLGSHQIILLAHEHGGDWDQMIAAAPQYKAHIEKVRDACYNFPLLVVGTDNHVVDGMHRLTRAIIDQLVTIRIKRFSVLPETAVIYE